LEVNENDKRIEFKIDLVKDFKMSILNLLKLMIDVSKDFPRATKKGVLWKVSQEDDIYKSA
jgi:hypothetical protein